MSEYYAYRIWLIQPARLEQKWDSPIGTKEDEFYKVLDLVKTKAKIEFKDKKSNMAMIFGQQITEDIFTWVFARKHNYTKEMLIDVTIEKVDDTDWPNANIIMHKVRQIVLIEKSQRFIPDIDITKTKLERFLTSKLETSGVKASLIEINNKLEFWREIEQMDFIEEVRLEIKPPNLFKGSGDWDAAMGRYKKAVNFESMKMWFKNKTSGLLFKQDEFGEPIKRLAQGQGDYKVIGQENGEKRVITSTDNHYFQILEDELSAEDPEKIVKAIDEADKLNDDEVSH